MQQHDTPIEAVRNRKNQKLFILVDDTLGTKFTVVNPTGEVLVLPDLLFDEDSIMVSPDEFATEFSPEQLEAYYQHQEKVALQAAQLKAASQRAQQTPQRIEPKKAPTPKREPRAKTPSIPARRGLGATWSSPRLTFYRHKIDPLHPKQTFKIVVEGTGEFEISKEDFLAHFNDVVMSPSYRADGLYTYPKVPEKASKYLKN